MAWRLLAVAAAVAVTIACGGDSAITTSPTPSPAPAPTPTPTPTPTPGPTTVSLTGTVSSVTGATLSGATVAILDGPNTGHSTQTNGSGEFRLDGLQAGLGTVSARANDYQESRRPVTVDGRVTVAFRLTPSLMTVNESFTGSLSASDALCSGSGGTADGKPCRRYPFTLYNNGTLAVSLTWSDSSTDLDLEYWRGSDRRLSTGRTGNSETISTTISPGSYEVRVVYAGGSSAQTYTLQITRTN